MIINYNANPPKITFNTTDKKRVEAVRTLVGHLCDNGVLPATDQQVLVRIAAVIENGEVTITRKRKDDGPLT